MSESDIRAWQFKYRVHACRKRLDLLDRPIEFRLTFDEWFDIWIASGQLFNRGKKKGQYVMARTADLGHYEIGNVEIKLATENTREANLGNRPGRLNAQKQRARKAHGLA